MYDGKILILPEWQTAKKSRKIATPGWRKDDVRVSQ